MGNVVVVVVVVYSLSNQFIVYYNEVNMNWGKKLGSIGKITTVTGCTG